MSILIRRREKPWSESARQRWTETVYEPFKKEIDSICRKYDFEFVSFLGSITVWNPYKSKTIEDVGKNDHGWNELAVCITKYFIKVGGHDTFSYVNGEFRSGISYRTGNENFRDKAIRIYE